MPTCSLTRLLTIEMTQCSLNTRQDVIRLYVVERATYMRLHKIGEYAGTLWFTCDLQIVVVPQPLLTENILVVNVVFVDLRCFAECFERAIDADRWLVDSFILVEK